MPPKKQSRRVAAWIYEVINPIIESLQRELSLLDSGNLTWRTYSHRCEMLRAIQEYVDPNQWPNYEDFLAAHRKPDFAAGFKQHDSCVDAINNAAAALFGTLVSLPAFLAIVEVARASYESRRESLGPTARPLADMGDGVNEEIAQHLINNAQTLPSHYVISSFWNSEARARLASLRSDTVFRPLNDSGKSLLEHSSKLKQALESFRLSLSREYDVPAARVLGLSFDE